MGGEDTERKTLPGNGVTLLRHIYNKRYILSAFKCSNLQPSAKNDLFKASRNSNNKYIYEIHSETLDITKL
jgi:hypothetical protein